MRRHENTGHWVGWSPPNNTNEGKTLARAHCTDWRGRVYQFGTTKTEMMVEVFDPLGRSVKRTSTHTTGSGTLAIDLGECLGLYLLRISANGVPLHSQRIICVK
jgi:hypothetical protein